MILLLRSMAFVTERPNSHRTYRPQPHVLCLLKCAATIATSWATMLEIVTHLRSPGRAPLPHPRPGATANKRNANAGQNRHHQYNISGHVNAGNQNPAGNKRRRENLPTCQLCSRVGHTVHQCGKAPRYFPYVFRYTDQGQPQDQYPDPQYYGLGNNH